MTAANIFMADAPSGGNVAIFSENGTSGDPTDPNSTRNLPLNNPATYLDLLKAHSGVDHFEVVAAGTKTVHYAQINGLGTPTGLSEAYGDDAGDQDDIVIAHGLGYAPLVIAAIGGNALTGSGLPIQTDAFGGARYATISADNTNVYISVFSTIGSANLAAIDIDVDYLVLADPPAATGDILVDWNTAGDGVWQGGFGKWRSDAPYMQVVLGGSPLGMLLGRGIDGDNGAFKAWRADLSSFAPVPSGLAFYLIMQSFGMSFAGQQIAGGALDYGGSYAGPDGAVLVQAP